MMASLMQGHVTPNMLIAIINSRQLLLGALPHNQNSYGYLEFCLSICFNQKQSYIPHDFKCQVLNTCVDLIAPVLLLFFCYDQNVIHCIIHYIIKVFKVSAMKKPYTLYFTLYHTAVSVLQFCLVNFVNLAHSTKRA